MKLATQKVPWDEQSIQAVRQMRANGALYTDIAQKIGRTPSAVRAVINRSNWSPQPNIPLADREKGLTVKTCIKCELDKPLDDFYVNAPRGIERRWPYCKPCEIARLADRREKGLHLPKLRRHVAKHREKYPEQAEANRIFSQAIRHGRIIRFAGSASHAISNIIGCTQMSLPSPETMLAYASILEKQQYVVHNRIKYPIATGEIVEAACAALRHCASLNVFAQGALSDDNPEDMLESIRLLMEQCQRQRDALDAVLNWYGNDRQIAFPGKQIVEALGSTDTSALTSTERGEGQS